MNKNATLIKYCNWCGDPFEVRSPNQKYCAPSEKDCSKEAKRESWRRAASNYRKKYKNVLRLSQVYKTGTGFLSANPHDDFDKEYTALVKEKKRLKLNGLLFGLNPLIAFTRPLMETPLNRNIITIFEYYPYLLIIALLLIGFLIIGVYHD